MATRKELKVLGKLVMAASVDAQMLGLGRVAVYLGMAFEDVVRVFSELDEVEVKVETEALLEGSGGEGDGS